MTARSGTVTILIADDDPDGRLLAREAMKAGRVGNDLLFVEDGEELLAYLGRRGRYADPQAAPRPGLILLDLNMPRKDGRQALREIKAQPGLRDIPVVVMTTSRSNEDVAASYDLGAAGFIVKPVSFQELVEIMRSLRRYWFETVELPEVQ